MSVLSPSSAPSRARDSAPLFDLLRYAERTAIVHDGRSLTYAQLEAATRRFAADHLSSATRQLVMIEMGNDADSVVAYLAALNHGHVPLLVSREQQTTELVATYDPDVTITHRVQHRRTGSAHDLHPDLALLLSTSGSTGSPKLVRLSRDNLTSNAAAIASYLGLDATDRAVTSLPLHYCYGLSVLHSHLTVGAGIVLTDLSVLDECFWRLVDTEQVSTLSAVPYTVDLLDRSGFAERDVPSLRRITQAGGRLRPESVRALADTGRRKNFELFVMYGQTEATARMAYLPPQLAAEHPDAVGVAIPGGTLRLDHGEVVYDGPNVMLGYAERPSDLALGRTVHELRTGDLGEFRDGLLHITGRANRVAKVFGLRIDIDRVEAQLTRPAHLVAGQDHLAVIGVHDEMACLATEVATICGLPTSAVSAVQVSEIPLTDRGKPDSRALTALAMTAQTPPQQVEARTVRDHFALVLGVDRVRDQDTFAGLGGDSLSYVELATRLESCLPGGVPANWHQMTVGELTAPARTHKRGTHQDTSITLRALAILLIIGSHVELFDLMGGAHVLLAVAGFNFARFTLTGEHRDILRRGLASLSTVVVPASVWIAVVALTTGMYRLHTAAFVDGFLAGPNWTKNTQFWFLEVLVWGTLAALALMSVPAVGRLHRRSPFGLALAVLAATAALRFLTTGIEANDIERYRLHAAAMFFALGWAAAKAADLRQRLIVTGATVLLTPGFFDQPTREAVVVVGILILLWLPTVPLPKAVAAVSGHIATYSLCIYLTHWVVYPPLETDHPVLAVLASIAVGTAYGVAMRPVQRRVSQLIRQHNFTQCGETRSRLVARQS